MRELVHGALADARELVRDTVAEVRGQGLTDDEVLARYETQRGDPLAIVDFVAQSRPDLAPDRRLEEAVRYELEMERLWRQRVGAGGTEVGRGTR